MTTTTRPVRTGSEQALALVRLDVLRKVSFISRYDTFDPDSPAPDGHGYQRPPQVRRFPSIGRHYLAGGAVTPLTVNVRIPAEKAEEYLDAIQAGDTERALSLGRLSIIDGQHRLGGMGWAQDKQDFNPMVPVQMFFGLSFEEEARLFDTINATQKVLPRSLIEVTKADITERNAETYSQAIRALTLHLARDEDSPWHDRVNFTGNPPEGKRLISFEALRRATADMFTSEFLARIVETGIDPLVLAKRYWNGVALANLEAWQESPRIVDDKSVPVSYRLHDASGIGALARLGRDVLHAAMEQEDKFGAIDELVLRLGDVDWEKRPDNSLMVGRAGRSGERVIYEALYKAVFTARGNSKSKAA